MVTTGALGESRDPARQLRVLERAEALPYVVYPPTPWWTIALLGFFFAAAVLSLSCAFTDANRVVTVVAVVVLATAMGAILAVVRLRYGAYPRPPFARTAPQEIRALYRTYRAGLLIVVALVVLTWWWVGQYAAGAVFVLACAGLALYENAYARVAAEVRARLGIGVA